MVRNISDAHSVDYCLGNSAKTSVVKDLMVFLFSQEYYDQLRRIASKFSRSSLREKVINVGHVSPPSPLPLPPLPYIKLCI